MNFRRYLKMAILAAATLTLTACGGGGETGPEWAQDLKAEIVPRDFSPGTYLSTCLVIPFVAGSEALQESDQVTYDFVETQDGTKLYVTHTLYSTLDCVDTGTSKQAEIRFPVSTIIKAGPTRVTGVELDDNDVTVIGEENMPGEKIFMIQSSSDVQITVFNGATLTDGTDPDLGALKVITSSAGNVLFNSPPLVDESIAKDVIVLKGNVMYLGIQDDGNDEAYDSDGYPLYVDLGLPITRQ